MSTRKRIILVCAVSALAAVACRPPEKVLVAYQYIEIENIGVKSIRIVHQLNTEGSFYDHVVRLCDVDAQGAETNCKDSLILETKVN